MDSLLAVTQSPSGPDPRPAVRPLSTAASDPQAKPAPADGRTHRRHDHPRAERADERPGRSHVQQALHHVVRDLRHAMGDEVKAGVAAGELDPETVGSIHELERDFRREMQDVFLQAGQQGGIDRQQVLAGMIEALQKLAAGLREVAGSEPADLEPRSDAVPAELTPVSAPGSLVDLTG